MQMRVANLQWADFVVWSPVDESFVQRIKYDSTFMNGNLLKAHVFYFKKFLPTVAPYLIVSPTDGSMELTKPVQYSLMGCKELNCCKLVLGHMDPTPNINEPEVNLEKQGYKGSNNKPQHLPNEETLDPKGVTTGKN